MAFREVALLLEKPMKADDMQSPSAWVAAALREAAAPPDFYGFSPDEVIAAAQAQGVLPMLEWQLRSGPDCGMLPEVFRNSLAEGARDSAMRTLFRESELQRISTVLSQGGFRVLLLKGPAFGRWLYPEPYLRVSGDVDLLFESRSESDRAMQALSTLGYELAFAPTGMTYEMTARAIDGTAPRPEIDLHCRLVNVPAYAEAFEFEELWGASIPVPGLDGLRMIDPMRSLAHACIHRAVDLYLHRPDRLKWLYDIHLMVERMDPHAWSSFIAMARAKEISGVCMRSIRDAAATFASQVPSGAMVELNMRADCEPLDWRRLDDWRYMQWQNFKALPTMGARLRWLWERLIPTRSHLRELHGEGSWLRLMGRRVVRAAQRFKQSG